MKRTVDTSVLVAAYGSWHASHDMARRALQASFVPIAHTLLEAYSTLTRMPQPARATPANALTFLESCVDHAPIALTGAECLALVRTLAGQGIAGGRVYDALIATTAMKHALTLFTLDTRASVTYEALGARYQLLA